MNRTITERNDLIEQNFSLVYYFALKYRFVYYDFDELLSLAQFGLCKAADSYDESRGVKFATYASRCIINEIMLFLRKWGPKLAREISLHNVIHKGRGANDDILLEDVIAVVDDGVLDIMEQKEQRAELRTALDRLSMREKQVIQMRYGLDNGKKQTQKEVSEAFGISQSYVSRIEKQATYRLKEVMLTA